MAKHIEIFYTFSAVSSKGSPLRRRVHVRAPAPVEGEDPEKGPGHEARTAARKHIEAMRHIHAHAAASFGPSGITERVVEETDEWDLACSGDREEDHVHKPGIFFDHAGENWKPKTPEEPVVTEDEIRAARAKGFQAAKGRPPTKDELDKLAEQSLRPDTN